jgi:ATP-dependent helicase/DNAse subunit B
MRHAPRTVVYLGPARSGKTQELVRQYIQAAGHRSYALQNVWLAPNARAAAQVRGQLLAEGLDACLSPGVMTFRDFTALVLADARLRVRSLRPVMERELLRRVVEQALKHDQLHYFADAARRSAFISLLADHIHELQRGDITASAYEKTRPPRSNEDEHRELALLYSAYEQRLAEHSLIDEDSSHRAARDALAGGKADTFRELNRVVADGFTDFTRTQHDILRLLAQRAEQLLISLPNDSTEVSLVGALPSAETMNPRTDLFAKSAYTLHELKRHHPNLEVREFPARPLEWPALDHVLRHVFRNPNELPAPSAEAVASLKRLQIVAGASVHDEIVQVARRIKERLTFDPSPSGRGQGEGDLFPTDSPSPQPSPKGRGSVGTRPGDIAVVFRSLSDAAPRIREVFDQFGIPYAIDANMPLAAAPVVKTLLSLLRLDGENWPFRRVVSIITNNMLTAFDDRARQAAEWLVRELQIVDGREKLLSRVEQFAAIETPLKELGDHTARRVAAAQLALPLFRQLAQSLEELPEVATPTEWFSSLVQLAAKLKPSPFGRGQGEGALEIIGTPSPQPSPMGRGSDDSDAWQALEAHFAALERLDAWLNSPPRKLRRAELIATLVDVAREPLPPAHDDVGRVRIVAAPAVRAIGAKHLYLAGMSEQSFPAPEAAGQLANADDYRFLARAGDQRGLAHFAESAEQNVPVPPSPGPTRSQDEMLLFYEVLSRAEESLTISYPALDDKAQRLPPSPYVLEIKRVFGDQHREALEPPRPQLSPVPSHEDKPYSIADYRVEAVARAIQSEPNLRPLAAILSSSACGLALDAGLRIVHARAHGASFGPAEGRLTSPAAAARLAARFGPDHNWSTSQLEKYAACRYKFFLENVLHLSPLGDLVLQTDAARRGSRLHGVLAAFHREWPSQRGSDEMSAEDEESRFLEYLHQVIDARTAAGPDGGIDAALLELDRRQIRKWADKHFDHHQKYGGAYTKHGVTMRPTHFEFRFGPPRPGADESDPNSVDTAFLLDMGGEQIRITGQIDRIDVGTLDGQTVFNVIDYKSGKKFTFSEDTITSGEHLQLPIYVEAAQVMLFGGKGTPLAAGYWWMSRGFDSRGALADAAGAAERWQSIRDGTRQLVAQFVNDIRHGEFPVFSSEENCTYCKFSTVCRVAQVRSLGKTVAPPPACGLANSTTTPGDP